MNNRIFVIADIHGELNKLNTLLNNLNIVESDRFIFLGDYVDRGPKSYEVIERLLSLNTTNRCDFILGNHDYEFFKDSFTNENDDSISNNERYRLWDHGVKETLASYINNNKSPEIHKSFYEMLKLYLIETINNKKYIFVHAGFNRNISIKSQDEYIEHMIYDRTLLIDAMLCHVKDFKQTGEFTNKDNFDYSRFKYGNNIKSATMIDALIALRGRKCEKCGLSTWLNLPITLEAHHIDGDHINTELNNLILLCPNCHSQTDSWRKPKVKTIIEENDFVIALQQKPNIRQALLSLGLSAKGANYERARELIHKHNIQHLL